MRFGANLGQPPPAPRRARGAPSRGCSWPRRRKRGHQTASMSGGNAASRTPPRRPRSALRLRSASAGSGQLPVKRRRMSWNRLPRSAAPGSRSSGSSGDQPQHAARIDRIGITPQRLDLGDREFLRPRVERRRRVRARRELFRLAGVEAARPGDDVVAARPHRLRLLAAGEGQQPLQPARGGGRRIAGPRRRGSSTMRSCPIAIMKSCAARPIRRSGGSRSSPPFIMRDMKRSDSARRGQLPSLSPPTTSVSTLCRRASSAPQIATRPSPPAAGLTISVGDQRRRRCQAIRRRPPAKSAVGGNQRTKEAGKLFAGVALVEAVGAAQSHRAPAPPAPRWSAARSRRSGSPGRRGKRRAARCASAKRRQHRARFVEVRLADPAEPVRACDLPWPKPRSVPRTVARASRHRACRCRRAAPPARSFRQRAEPCCARCPAAGTDASASAAIGTGLPGLNTASRSSASNSPGGVRASGVPPESSARMPKRSNSALTRRARSRSLVTSAAVALGSTMAPRSAVAIASASSRSLAASIRVTPASAASNRVLGERRRAIGPIVGRFGRPQRFAQDRAAHGQRRRRARRSRPHRARLEADLAQQLGADRIADGRTPTAAARPPRSTDHDRSSSARSRPGSTTAPLGRRAIADSSSAVAGIEPVEPAAITGPMAGARASRAASRRISALRCAAGLERSRSRKRLRPMRRDDLQEVQRDLPPAREIARTRVRRASSSRRLRSRSRRSARRGRAPARWHRPPKPARSRLPRTARRHAPAAGSSSACTSGASASSRSSGAIGGASSISPASASKAASSSSNSPSGRIDGRIAERPPSRSANTRAQLARGAPRRHEDGGVGQRQRRAIPARTPEPAFPQARRRPVSAGRARPPGSTGRAESALAVTILAAPLRRRPARQAGSRPACRP